MIFSRLAILSIFLISVILLNVGYSIAASYGNSEMSVDAQLYKIDSLGIGVSYTPDCLYECHMPLNFSYTGSEAEPTRSLNLSSIYYIYNKLNSDDDLQISEVNVYFNRSFSKEVVETDCQNVPGKTQNNTDIIIVSCTSSSTNVDTWKWDKINIRESPYEKTINKNSWTIIDFVLKRKPRTGFWATDFIPAIFNFEFRDFAWLNSSFANKKQISLTTNVTSDVSNAIAPIILDTSSSHRNDCADIRIVNNSETGTRNFAIDSGCGTANTVVWANVNLSSSSYGSQNAGYHYYNNPSAENQTNNPSPFNSNWKLFMPMQNSYENFADETNNGTINGPALNQYVTNGRYGSGFTTSNNRWISLSNANLLDLSSNFTWGLWFKPNGTDGGFQAGQQRNYFFETGSPTAGCGFWVQTGAIKVDCAGAVQRIQYSYIFPTDSWVFLVFTMDGASDIGYLYLNGTLVQSKTQMTALDSTETRFTIGDCTVDQCVGGGVHLYANGTIDNPFVVNRMMSQNEINILFNTTTVSSSAESYAGEISESSGRTVIEEGIHAALGNSTRIYTDQQIYIRNASNYQQLSRFDKVVKFGSQRWAFNYITGVETLTNMPGLGNIFYVLEMQNRTSANISASVKNYILQTKVS